MSLPLHDLRAKVSPEAHCALLARAMVEGKDVSEIVRVVLHERALREISVGSVLQGLLKAEGIQREVRG